MGRTLNGECDTVAAMFNKGNYVTVGQISYGRMIDSQYCVSYV